MSGVQFEQQLRDRIEELEAELAQRVDEAVEKELQLQRYAADLRETFMQERSRSEQLRHSYTLTVRALASAVEARDAYTGRHAERVAAYGLALAEVYGMRLGDNPQIEFGFLLHDVGKVAVPDAILFKPGPLTRAERLVMQQHPARARRSCATSSSSARRATSSALTTSAGTAAATPTGSPARTIPLAARVFAVADTLDALTTERPYRRCRRRSPTARAIIDEGDGTHFDPDVLAAFRKLPDATIEQHPAEDRMSTAPRRADRRRRPVHPQAHHDDARGRRRSSTCTRRATAWRRSQIASRESPRLVFLDIDMPRLDGIEACRRMRADAAMAARRSSC